VLGDPDEKKASIAGLVSARGLIRHELGKRLQNLKFSPELRFELDPSIEYSVHINELLKEVLPAAPEVLPAAPVGPSTDQAEASDQEVQP